MHFEIESVIFKMCIVREPETTPGTLLLLARDTGVHILQTYFPSHFLQLYKTQPALTGPARSMGSARFTGLSLFYMAQPALGGLRPFHRDQPALQASSLNYRDQPVLWAQVVLEC